MDATLNALGNLLLTAIPTVIFFLFLTAYLNRVYFRPLARILDQRRQAGEGLRELSERALASADQKTTEFERALQLARADINAENEQQRRQWAHQQMENIAKARAEAEARLVAARQSIASEIAEAENDMQSQIQPLTQQIIATLSRRRAA